MTREELVERLTSVLNEFDHTIDLRESDTSVLLHLIFRDDLVDEKEELWWDENLLQFIPEEPQ